MNNLVEVERERIRYFSMAQIINNNPILVDSGEIKTKYLEMLKCLINAGGWTKTEYIEAELRTYEAIIFNDNIIENKHSVDYYKHYILFDLVHILSYSQKNLKQKKINRVKKAYFKQFEYTKVNDYFFDRVFGAFVYGDSKIKNLMRSNVLDVLEKQYVKNMYNNYKFINKPLKTIMVTATMSAGKSSFINAVFGKKICLSQNMACTSKIHKIINKAYDDGLYYESDSNITFMANENELMEDNQNNLSDLIYVGASAAGWFSSKRIVIEDTPGINYSLDKSHKEKTKNLVSHKKYDLLIYIMNFSQLATNDESEYLDFLKSAVGEKPVLFILNKVDVINPEEEDIDNIIFNLKEFLKSKGFKYPIVCPLSSKAGFISKKYSTAELTKNEKSEMYRCIDKLEHLKLAKYYSHYFKNIKVKNEDIEEKQLLKTSGLAYVEQIIKKLIVEGVKNGTGIY